MFGRAKPPLVIALPKAGDPIVFDSSEESALLERQADVVELVGETLYDEATAREIERSQASLALLIVALNRLRVGDFHGATSTCVKTVAVWDSGVAWWVGSEIYRLYGDKRGAGRLLERADQAAERYDPAQRDVRPYAARYRRNELEQAMKIGQEFLALSLAIKVELEAKIEYLRGLDKLKPPYATLREWLESWYPLPTDGETD